MRASPITMAKSFGSISASDQRQIGSAHFRYHRRDTALANVLVDPIDANVAFDLGKPTEQLARE
jgi:hypothetical protein